MSLCKKRVDAPCESSLPTAGSGRQEQTFQPQPNDMPAAASSIHFAWYINVSSLAPQSRSVFSSAPQLSSISTKPHLKMALLWLQPPRPMSPQRFKSIFNATTITLGLGLLIWKFVLKDKFGAPKPRSDQDGTRVYPTWPPGPYDADTMVPSRKKSIRQPSSATQFDPETRILASSVVNDKPALGLVFDPETGVLLRGSLSIPDERHESPT